MKKVIIAVLSVVLLAACGNSNKTYVDDELYQDPVAIHVDSANQEGRNEQLTEPQGATDENAARPSASSTRSTQRRSPKGHDNMRGFDPASEDDMDDNGMSRYFENNDDEGWD